MTFFIISGVLLFFSVYLFFYNSVVLNLFLPVLVFSSEMSISLCFDFVSCFFFCFVSFISGVVFIYSKYYMNVDKNFQNSDQIRFMCILFLFVISMFFLVFSFSWFLVMLGWDGLGVVSFLLVIFYNDSKSLDSGVITFLTNRVGDCFFILSFMFMYYSGFFSSVYLVNTSFFLFYLFVMLGAITKSAQMPFSAWLPAAMAAPTPVSSLVHSSTLVTAGVFLLIRFNYLLSEVFYLLMIISLLTMSMAGIFANFEMDFKKIVAMSTLSQLGFMVFSISCGNWLLGFLHMVFHAFFKSSLFLSTGSLMHLIQGDQDSRVFSSFYMSFFSKLFFTMSCLCLMGFPFSLGFYSKDFILGSVLHSSENLMISFLFVLSCMFTVSYSIRLLMLGFSKYVLFNSFLIFGEDKNFFMPVTLLFLVSILCGNFFMYYFLPQNMVFSFPELISGMVVLLMGLIFYNTSVNSYFFVFSFSSMNFLPLMNFKFSSNFMSCIFYEKEHTWNEIFTAKLSENFFKNFIPFLKSFFFSNFIFIGVFFMMIIIFI
uniref:NADH:ubiquinone reductase (H(+)-translocating) n=1 Tax=Psoroptes ovis TaxID=83912 RepID=A0A075X7M8_PSOOV|nr:NADH dehydrogenase subunit 5 [Psoroptes ovis]AIH15208.1 NADH dehydrogenase subunit 5 [Psoroptes ovis]